jgi:hypothetical protein
MVRLEMVAKDRPHLFSGCIVTCPLSPSSGVKLSSTFLRMLFRSLFLLFTLIHPFRLSLSLSNFSSDDDDDVVSLMPMLSQRFLMMMMMLVNLMARRFHDRRR